MLGSFILLVLKYFNTLVSWLESNMLPCYFKYFFGIDCPGCGLQRSILLLMSGNLKASIQMYPPLLPIIFVLLLHFLNKVITYKNKTIIFKLSVWSAAALTAANFFYKLSVNFTSLVLSY